MSSLHTTVLSQITQDRYPRLPYHSAQYSLVRAVAVLLILIRFCHLILTHTLLPLLLLPPVNQSINRSTIRLTHLRPTDLAILHGLRSLFCLSLSAPCVNGSLYPGFPSAVRLQHVEEVVESSLPYCDFELQAEPDMTAVQ